MENGQVQETHFNTPFNGKKKENMVKLFFFLIAINTFIGCNYLDPHKGCNFDSEIWKSVDKDWRNISKRMCMVNDLKKKYLKKGLTKDSVVQLLGNPIEPIDPQNFKYSIGSRKNSIDPEFLFLRFDAYDKINSIYLKIR